MARVFREGMEVPQDIDGGSATKKKKRKKAPPVKLPPLRPGQIDLPSDPDDGSVGMKKGGVAKGKHRMPDGKMMDDKDHQPNFGKSTRNGIGIMAPTPKRNMDPGVMRRPKPGQRAMDPGMIREFDPDRKKPTQFKKGGVTRADGIAKRGHTKGRLV
tara:strand:- start:340 stop:810 length:471 start_codon:yes stop_codon:yes gene_type:complete